jgi:hypothetical protein
VHSGGETPARAGAHHGAGGILRCRPAPRLARIAPKFTIHTQTSGFEAAGALLPRPHPHDPRGLAHDGAARRRGHVQLRHGTPVADLRLRTESPPASEAQAFGAARSAGDRLRAGCRRAGHASSSATSPARRARPPPRRPPRACAAARSRPTVAPSSSRRTAARSCST